MEHDQGPNEVSRADLSRLKKKIAVRFVLALLFLGIIFFWPAGTFHYWQAWVYIAILFIPMMGILVYFIRKDPELLERRMKSKEKERRQKTIIATGSLVYLGIYLLPGFDRRYGWSSVPVFVVIFADILVLAGYCFFARILKENRYASRIVEVTKEQVLISTGPYAWIRHPMYLAVVIMYVLTPLALGSYWAVLPALSLIVILVARIQNEEKVLLRELPGYRDYQNQVRYRLIPGVW